MDLKTKRTYRVTGLFVAIAILLLALFILFIAVKQNAFTKKIAYYTIVDNAVGITKSSPIIFKGYEIGKVKNFRLNKDNDIELEFVIYQEFSHLIVENSVLEKNVHPVTGRGTLEFFKGRSSEAIIPEKNFLLSSDSPDGRKALNENKERGRGEPISALINKLERFVDNLGRDENYDEGAFFRMIYNLAELSEGLNNSVSSLNKIINSLNNNQSEDNGVIFRLLNNVADLSEELKKTNETLTTSLTSFNTLIGNYQQPEGLIAKMIDPSGKEIIQPASESLLLLQKTLKELSEFSEFINTNSPELLLLISEGKKALDEAQKTLEGINSNPLIKGGITRPEEPTPGSKIRQERE